MIASCPSCGTLYKHEGPGEATRGRCACCEGVVHLAARRHYAVRTGGVAVERAVPVLARAGSGTSEPKSRTATDKGSGPSSAPSGMAFGGGGGIAGLAVSPAVAEVEAIAGRGIEDVASAAAAPAPQDAARVEVTADPPGSAPRSHAIGGCVVGLTVGALAGMLEGWGFGGDPVVWWIGGALLGAIVGWGVGAQWTSRKT